MPKFRHCWMLLAVLAGFSLTAQAADTVAEDARTAQRAVEVLRDVQAVPDNAIPDLLLDEARGILVVPDTLKVGVLFAARHGEGLLSLRTADGGWSNPVPVILRSGSLGLQAGVEKTDLILVFRNDHQLNKLTAGRLTLGAGGSVAAGPVGRAAGRAIDDRLKADIWSWARGRGLFAGVALDGGAIAIDDAANQRAYGQGTTPRMVFEQRSAPAPSYLAAFRTALEETSTAAHNRRMIEREETERTQRPVHTAPVQVQPAGGR